MNLIMVHFYDKLFDLTLKRLNYNIILFHIYQLHKIIANSASRQRSTSYTFVLYLPGSELQNQNSYSA